jgi:alcohol dehydrogenase (cytochrome c)
MTTRFLLVPVLLAAGGALLAQGPLDASLLGKPPVEAWPTYHGDYSGRHYSTLNQINQSNVKGLSLAWLYRINTSKAGAVVGGEGPDDGPGAGNPTIK